MGRFLCWVSNSNSLCSTTWLDIHTLADGAATLIVNLPIYPLDMFKTRYSSPDYAKIYVQPEGCQTPALFHGLYQGIGSVILVPLSPGTVLSFPVQSR